MSQPERQEATLSVSLLRDIQRMVFHDPRLSSDHVLEYSRLLERAGFDPREVQASDD